MTQQADREPVQISWKISKVLDRYPEALDYLVAASPAFKRLRNPIQRRIQGRLVTVEAAAAIAGINPHDLAHRLNIALGIGDGDARDGMPAPVREEQARPPWVDTATLVTELDVRPLLEQGGEPFSLIMAAARETGKGAMFALRASFEPVPLYDVLGQRGFEHYANQLGEDDWRVLFFNAGTPRKREVTPKAEGATRPEPATPPAHPAATITIEVSDLVPPEPMIRILETLETLEPGQSLLVHHVRPPVFLYPRLDELGYRHETREHGPGQVEILIEKPLAAGIGSR